jgi:hypothetical protein
MTLYGNIARIDDAIIVGAGDPGADERYGKAGDSDRF